MKKSMKIIILCIIVMLINNTQVMAANDDYISDNDFEEIIDVISNSNLENGESVTIGERYTIECVENEFINPQRSVYSITRDITHTVYDNGKKVFEITQIATAAFNPYTEQVMISSHSVNVESYSSGFTYVSQAQKSSLYDWTGYFVLSAKDIIVRKDYTNYTITAHALVYYNGNKFDFSLIKGW